VSASKRLNASLIPAWRSKSEFTVRLLREPFMKRTAGEEFAAIYGMSPAANEDLAGANRQDSLTRHQSGWDPYDVWRTRLKRPSVGTQEREPLPGGRGGCKPGRRLRATLEDRALLRAHLARTRDPSTVDLTAL
jgi:hypothetical protein